MARLAAFDMDGTLLMPDHRLGEKTLNTLKRLRERDVTLTFATGRHVLEMRHLLGAFSLDAFQPGFYDLKLTAVDHDRYTCNIRF